MGPHAGRLVSAKRATTTKTRRDHATRYHPSLRPVILKGGFRPEHSQGAATG